MNQKQNFILLTAALLFLVFLTGCANDDGNNAFRSLRNKIDTFNETADFSDCHALIFETDFLGIEGSVVNVLYDTSIRYLSVTSNNSEKELYYEFVIIEDDLIHLTVIDSSTESEYILYDNRIAVYDTNTQTLTEVEDTHHYLDAFNTLRELVLQKQ